MKFRAVLGIKVHAKNKVRDYRIVSENNEVRDVPIEKIKEVLAKGVIIEGLQLINNEVVETVEIMKIPQVGDKLSLYNWCLENGERGQRILTEFNTADNFPLKAKDISAHSAFKAQFKCTVCHKINIQKVQHKTGKEDSKCRYCAGRENICSGISLQQWCNTHGEYGVQLLQEFIGGDNDFSPDQVSYASSKYANFKCSTCGTINKQIITSKTKKNPRGCKYCDNNRTSFGEQIIFIWLQSQGIEIYNQYKIQTYLGTKEFDIYVPELNLVIEHQSGMHAPIEKQINDDKTELIAQQLGLNLLEICLISSNYQRQESNWCITYKLNHESEMINKLSLWLNTNYGLNTNPNYTRVLEDQAYLNSCKVKYEQSIQFKNPPFLKEWNYELNYPVTPDKVALNSNRKYYWTCSTCNHIYLANPANRNNGSACPNYRNHNKY